MARKPRIYVEGCSYHVIQRGNNRDACFFQEVDYAFYMQSLKEAADKYKVEVNAFVLMTNHVHLLVTPVNAQGLSQMMQSLGRRYVRYINLTYKRTGTLWEGRFKSTIVDTDEYFFTLCRYIEMNPVKARMVASPREYPWSSFRYHGMGVPVAVITPHKNYLSLGATNSQRLLAYRALFELPNSIELDKTIRHYSENEWVIGCDKFRSQIEQALGRSLVRFNWGGDRKSDEFKEFSSSLTP